MPVRLLNQPGEVALFGEARLEGQIRKFDRGSDGGLPGLFNPWLWGPFVPKYGQFVVLRMPFGEGWSLRQYR
jgi:hypothetical protein